MLKKRWILAAPGILAIAAFAGRSAGGWAVVGVQDLPDYAVAGQPLTITYSVRQHGEELMPNLKGMVSATAGSATINVPAQPTAERGFYAATVNLPNAGNWSITIESGFGKSRIKQIPMHVVAAGTKTLPALAPEERGRRLFVAKGCVTCHTHSESQSEIGDGAPELTGKKFAPSYLAEFLSNPKIKPSAQKNGWQMPNPQLKQNEIAALVAFINSDKSLAAR